MTEVELGCDNKSASFDPNFFLTLSSSLVEISLHAENQLPRLSGSALKVYVGWWWVSLNYVVTPTLYWVAVGP